MPINDTLLQYGKRRLLSKRRAQSYSEMADSSMPSDDSVSEDVSERLAEITEAWKQGGVIGGKQGSGVLKQQFGQKLPQEEVVASEEIPEEEFEYPEEPVSIARRPAGIASNAVIARMSALQSIRIAEQREREEEEKTKSDVDIPGLPGFVKKMLNGLPEEELADFAKTARTHPSSAYSKAGKIFKSVVSGKIGSVFAELFIWFIIIFFVVFFQFVIIKVFPWESFRLVAFVLIVTVFAVAIVSSFSMAMLQSTVCENWIYKGAAFLWGYGNLCAIE